MSDKKYLWGLDISLKQTGIAVYELTEREFVLIDSFNTEKIYATKENKNLLLHGVKLKKIIDWIKGILKDYPPIMVIIERGFVGTGNETPAIFKTHGAINCLLWNIPQVYYPPNTVKSEIWHGHASKQEVEVEILKRFPDLKMANDDESDAVAVALCHLIKVEYIQWEKSEGKPAPKKKKSTKKKKVEE
jgi:Holliday junction resolvasome RuvABC endonuclease subunit